MKRIKLPPGSKSKDARVLLLDIETSPNLAYVWGYWEQNVLRMKTPWNILAVAYKWLGERETFVITNERHNDRKVLAQVHKLLDEADVVIAHNGDAFDLKKINTRFAFYEMTPPAPYKTIDTLKVARRHFAFNSNKLNDLGQFLRLGQKIRTGGADLWFDCMAGDAKAWERMRRYNKQDVVLLEKVYLALLPWTTNHPNIANLLDDDVACPKCGSRDLHARGFARNATTRYRRFQCKSCGGWARATKNMKRVKPLTNA